MTHGEAAGSSSGSYSYGTVKQNDDTTATPDASETGAAAAPMAGATFNLVNYIIGLGVLGLPYAFSQSGLVVGLLILVIVALSSVLSFMLLLWSSELTQTYTYEEIAYAAYGQRMCTAVKVIIVLDCFGNLAASLNVVGDALSSFFTSKFSEAPDALLDARTLNVIVIFAFLVPLALIQDLTKLGFASFLSLMPILYLFGLQAQSLAADGSQGSIVYGPAKPGGVFIALPIVVFAFSAHQALFMVYEELRAKGGRYTDVEKVVTFSFGITTIGYSTVGALGYLRYTDAVTGNLLNSYPDSIAVDVLLMSISASIVLGYPLVIYSCRLSLDRLLYPDVPSTYRRFVIQNMFIIAASMAVNIVIPSFIDILGLFGSVTKTIICFFLPALFYLRLVPGRALECACWESDIDGDGVAQIVPEDEAATAALSLSPHVPRRKGVYTSGNAYINTSQRKLLAMIILTFGTGIGCISFVFTFIKFIQDEEEQL